MLEGKRILVTGGAGFIGSNLCEFFLQKNEVYCLDNLLTGHKSNIAHLINHPHFTFIEGDVRDYETCLKAAQDIDIIFHQAALGSVPRSIEIPLNTNAHNITGFLNMLEAAKNASVKRFVYEHLLPFMAIIAICQKKKGRSGNRFLLMPSRNM